MENIETIPAETTNLEDIAFAWNFTCPNITNNYSPCNTTFGNYEQEYVYDYDTSLAAILLAEYVLFSSYPCFSSSSFPPFLSGPPFSFFSFSSCSFFFLLHYA